MQSAISVPPKISKWVTALLELNVMAITFDRIQPLQYNWFCFTIAEVQVM